MDISKLTALQRATLAKYANGGPQVLGLGHASLSDLQCIDELVRMGLLQVPIDPRAKECRITGRGLLALKELGGLQEEIVDTWEDEPDEPGTYEVTYETTLHITVRLYALNRDDAETNAGIQADGYLETLVGDHRGLTAEASLDGVGADKVARVGE